MSSHGYRFCRAPGGRCLFRVLGARGPWIVALAALVVACAPAARPKQDAPNPAKLANGLYAVLATTPDAATAGAAAGSLPHVVLIDDGRYVGATDEPAEWVAISPDPFVPLALAAEPVLGTSEKGFASLALSLAPESARILEEFTSAHLGDTVAIVIGGEIVTKHTVKAVITGGQLQITRCTDNGCEVLRTRLLEEQ